MAETLGYYWFVTKDGDPRVSSIYKRHYSCRTFDDCRRSKAAYRQRHLCLGPGEKLVLITADCQAAFGWRKFIDRSGQQGVNCAFFRNEGAYGGKIKSSELVAKAQEIAWKRWPGERLYTYVDPTEILSDNPGYCFKKAGWKTCGETKTGLKILSIEPEV